MKSWYKQNWVKACDNLFTIFPMSYENGAVPFNVDSVSCRADSGSFFFFEQGVLNEIIDIKCEVCRCSWI